MRKVLATIEELTQDFTKFDETHDRSYGAMNPHNRLPSNALLSGVTSFRVSRQTWTQSKLAA